MNVLNFSSGKSSKYFYTSGIYIANVHPNSADILHSKEELSFFYKFVTHHLVVSLDSALQTRDFYVSLRNLEDIPHSL